MIKFPKKARKGFLNANIILIIGSISSNQTIKRW